MDRIVQGFFALSAAILALGGGGAALAATDPPLTVPAATLRAAFECTGPLAGATKDPVLLVHGTGSTPEEDFGWNWAAELPRTGRQACLVRLPYRSVRDIQVSAEYVVYAMRRMIAESGRRIAVVAHSQGGLEPRWALRYWPSLAGHVSDVISMGTPQTGTDGAVTLCKHGCGASVWQQATGSHLLRTLNRVPTPGGADYTSIWTPDDEIVTPQPRGSHLSGAANIGTTDICPGHFIDHFGLSADGVVWAIGLDALDHPGPAVAARVPRSACANRFVPGVTALDFTLHVNSIVNAILYTAIAPPIPAEPPLRCYALGTCAPGGTRALRFADLVALPSSRACVRSPLRLRVRHAALRSVKRLQVRVNHGRARTVRGRALRRPISIRIPRRGRFTLHVSVRTTDGRLLRATRRYRVCGSRR